MRKIALIALMTLLTACNTAPPYVHTCPVPKQYTDEEKARAKSEAHFLPYHSEIGEMLKDYSVLAQQSRDCWSH